MSEISYAKYLANPKYRKFPFKGLAGWLLANRPPSVEDLQDKYAFSYYSTMNNAVTDVNNGTTANADAQKGTAVAGVYTDENGGKNVVLLKDYTEATRIDPSVDMTINLGGHVLSTNNKVLLQPMGGHIIVDGRLAGSTIEIYQTNLANNANLAIQVAPSAVLYVFGGTIVSSSENCEAMAISNFGTTHVSGCKVVAHSVSKVARAINNRKSITVDNCELVASSKGHNSFGVFSDVSATISNCNIRAYSNYLDGDDDYAAYSIGIQSSGTMILNDCYVLGTHSGVQSTRAITVNGGIYEGYGHGGIYFGGEGTTSYVRDAILRDCDMPDGYTATSQRNGAGFYIGGGVGKDNISVYMDNCRISSLAESQTIVLRGSSGEQNNSLYISNSDIYTLDGRMGRIRIDNNTHKLYIGVGNNFTAEDTNNPEAVVATDEVYREVA